MSATAPASPSMRPGSVRSPRCLIAGEWLEGSDSREVTDVYDPSTGRVLCEMTSASDAQIEAAVRGAREAFDGWAGSAVGERERVLRAVSHALERGGFHDALLSMLTLDQGKTLAEARGEIKRAKGLVDGAISLADELAPVRLADDHGLEFELWREPIGVCVGISPMNFPVMIPAAMIANAVICGNTVVLKPSELTPIVTTTLVEAFVDAGLPPGVVSLLHGGGRVAESLINHSQTVAVSSITSTPVAAAIYHSATNLVKRVQANGGAKNPIIVAADADMQLAARGIASSAFGMAGQRCLAGSILIAVGQAHEQVLGALVEVAAGYTVGDPFADVTMGPVASAPNLDRLMGAIQAGLDDGCRAVLDGRSVAPAGRDVDDGYYIGPTVLDDVEASPRLLREELFGPVLSVRRAGSLDEAIGMCNNSAFGNAASIFTRSAGVRREFEERTAAGNLGVNLGVPLPAGSFPLGGRRGSFFGEVHTGSKDNVVFFTDPKTISRRSVA